MCKTRDFWGSKWIFLASFSFLLFIYLFIYYLFIYFILNLNFEFWNGKSSQLAHFFLFSNWSPLSLKNHALSLSLSLLSFFLFSIFTYTAITIQAPPAIGHWPSPTRWLHRSQNWRTLSCRRLKSPLTLAVEHVLQGGLKLSCHFFRDPTVGSLRLHLQMIPFELTFHSITWSTMKRC